MNPTDHSAAPPPPRCAFDLRWQGWSDRGRVRPNNEDSFLGLRFNDQELDLLGKSGEAGMAAHDFAFAVSDGMGGALAGEYASRIALEKIKLLLPRTFSRRPDRPAPEPDGVLTKLFAEIHRALLFLGSGYPECAGMETTLTLAWLTPGRLHFGHIGDTRLYHLRRGEPASLRQLTEDDTHVGWLYRQGKLNEREARQHPRRNVLQKALGGGNQFVTPQIGTVDCAAGDRFLICSDGLTEAFTRDQLAEVLAEVPLGASATDNAAGDLVRTAVARDGRDNTTAVLLDLR